MSPAEPSPPPSTPVLRRQLEALLREALEGPREAWSYFTDHGASAGLLGTIGERSAGEVNRPGEGGTASVAAHIHHVAFGMEASVAFIRGDRTPRDWKESWISTPVDEARWREIRERLKEAYQDLLRTLREADLSSDEAFGGALAAVAHVAYHLGAVRQRLSPGRPASP